MDSEDDIQPLIGSERLGSRDTYLELTAQNLNTDPDFEQVSCSVRHKIISIGLL